MGTLLRRLPLEGAVRLAIVVTVLDVAFGSNWSPDVRAVAGPLRWLLLGGLCVLSLAYAWSQAGSLRPRPRPAAYWFAAALLALALASALWSLDPRLTVARCIAFGTLLVAAGALALPVASDREAAGRVLVAVLGGAVAVALAGLVALAVDPGEAVQEATSSTAARFRGIGQNPNTVSMLFAVGMPIATWLLLRERGARRVAAGAVLALLAGSIVASGSRGALVAGFAAAAVPALASARGSRAVAATLATAALGLAAGLGVTTLPDPDPNYRRSASDYTTPCTRNDAQCYLRLEDEIGRPPGGRYEPPGGRSLLGSSGRRDAWGSALGLGAERPVAGFGFATESRAFVDRSYSFQGGVPENSFIGIFLQLGVLGIVLLGGLALSLLAAAARALRARDDPDRPLAAACAAVLLAGLGLALFQSYLYAAGNTATLSVWICAFLLTALAAPRAVRN
ncbi:MAG: O-antigen ligase family protein [Gaiellaceae bacterium]